MLSLDSIKITVRGDRTLKQVWYAFIILLLVVISVFLIFYVSSSYDALKSWYYSLNDCFLNSDTWATNFFTQEVKRKGNILALPGLGISISFMIYTLWAWKNVLALPKSKRALYIPNWGWYLMIGVCGLLLGIWSWNLAHPANDEVFSAVDCAELHPIQTLTYYMAPNNHIYFNLLNNILFHWCNDHVFTGRLISLVAYVCVLLCVFHWLSRIIGNARFAFIALLPVALQLTTLGFAGQARGYEGQLLCGWLSFITMLNYNKSGSKKMLQVHTLVNIAGFALVPTYFFWYGSLTLTMLCITIYKRSFRWAYWKSQIVLGCVVFLLYLPAICFSGLDAFVNNVYVKPAYSDWIAFLPDFTNDFNFFINFCFSNLCGEDRAINYVLFFLPLALFFSRRKERRFLAFFYVILWSVFIAVNLKMRHPAFNRNLILHYSITMAFVVYTLFVLIEAVANQFKLKQYASWFAAVFFAIPVFIFCGHLIKHDNKEIATDLYFNNTGILYRIRLNDINAIPKGSSVAFSNYSFYFYYFCRKMDYITSRCANEHEDYYVVLPGSDPMPAWVTNNYELFRKGADNYEIYKRK